MHHLVSPHRRHTEAVITNFCKDLQQLFYGGASQLWTGKGWISWSAGPALSWVAPSTQWRWWETEGGEPSSHPCSRQTPSPGRTHWRHQRVPLGIQSMWRSDITAPSSCWTLQPALLSAAYSTVQWPAQHFIMHSTVALPWFFPISILSLHLLHFCIYFLILLFIIISIVYGMLFLLTLYLLPTLSTAVTM